MLFIDELKPMFTRKGFLLLSVGVLSGLMWILHFIFEYRVIEVLGLPLHYVLFHLVALPFGSLLYLQWSSNHDQKMSFIVSCILLAISILGLAVAGLAMIKNDILIMLLLIVIGLSNGYIIPVLFSMLSLFFKNPEYSGRIYYLVYSGVIVVVILEVIIVFFIKETKELEWIGEIFHILYLMGLILVVVTTFFIGKDESILPPRKTQLRFYLRKNVLPYPVLLLSFFIGFFMTNVFTTGYMIFRTKFTGLMSRIPQSWNIFLFVLFVTSLLACLPSAYLYDKIGRRWTILIGFYLEAIAFIAFLGPIDYLFETLFPSTFSPASRETIFFLLIFPLMSGIGLSLALFGGLLVVLYEQAPGGFSEIHGSISTMVFGFGMVFGVITFTTLGPIIEHEPILLPVIMIFVYFTATIVIFQTDEPLPSRAELDWRRKVQHVIVLSREGLPLFSQSFQEHDLVSDEILAGGVIIGISELINEITHASSELKVIKQKSYCIMLEGGSYVILAVIAQEELKTIRTKMIDFTADFEEFFEELLVDWTGDTHVFKPAKKLLKKHFA